MTILSDCLAAKVKSGDLSQDAADTFKRRLADAEKRAAESGMDGPGAYVFASSQASQDMLLSARRRRAEIATMILAVDRGFESAGQHSLGRTMGLVALLGENLRGENRGGVSLVARQKALFGTLQSFLAETVESFRSKAAGLVKETEAPRHMVLEMYGESTGSAMASTAAKGWTEAGGFWLDHMKIAGVRIRELKDWLLPQEWTPGAVRHMGPDRFVAWMTERWERGRLRLRDWDAGAEAALRPDVAADRAKATEIFSTAYANITTDGWASLNPGAVRRGASLADRYNRRRVFEWTTADAWLEFNATFGVGDDAIFELLHAHLKRWAHDLALAQTFGPDPDGAVRTILDMGRKEGLALPSGLLGTLYGDRPDRFLEAVWHHASGKGATVQGETLANIGRDIRQGLTAVQLGGAILSAPTDWAWMALTSTWNGLPFWRVGERYLRALNPANKADRLEAMRTGWILDTGTRTMADAARDSLGDLANRLPGRIADFVLRAQGLALHSDAGRRAMHWSFLARLADVAGESRDSLPAAERHFLDTYGITAAQWNTLRAGALSTHPDGWRILDPAELARSGATADREAAFKLLGAIAMELRYAVPEGNTLTKAVLLGQTQPGTGPGEALRAFAQYKSFSAAVWLLHLGRAMDNIAQPYGDWYRGQYLLGLAAGATVLGALSLQLKSVAAGKDAESMDRGAFWWRAAIQGGGAGIFGDFLQNAVSARSGGDVLRTLAGPTAGLIGDTAILAFGNPYEAAQGKDTNAGREAVRYANRYMNPNVFYTRLAAQRLMWDSLQKMADPDYHGLWQRMKDRARKDQDVGFWWGPGETAPSRAPRIPLFEGTR